MSLSMQKSADSPLMHTLFKHNHTNIINMTEQSNTVLITLPGGHTLTTDSSTFVTPAISGKRILVIGAGVTGLVTSCKKCLYTNCK
jgi:hypothetical protein